MHANTSNRSCVLLSLHICPVFSSHPRFKRLIWCSIVICWCIKPLVARPALDCKNTSAHCHEHTSINDDDNGDYDQKWRLQHSSEDFITKITWNSRTSLNIIKLESRILFKQSLVSESGFNTAKINCCIPISSTVVIFNKTCNKSDIPKIKPLTPFLFAHRSTSFLENHTLSWYFLNSVLVSKIFNPAYIRFSVD